MPLTVPRLTDSACVARPEAAEKGMDREILPDAGEAPLTFLSVPSVLNVTVPWLSVVEVTFEAVPA